MVQTSPFLFATEFNADGEVLSGPERKYFSRDEADQLAAKARAEGEARAKQAGFASVDRIVGALAPVAAQLSAAAEQLRAEAAELAMIAAKRIAFTAAASGARTAETAHAFAVSAPPSPLAPALAAAAR